MRTNAYKMTIVNQTNMLSDNFSIHHIASERNSCTLEEEAQRVPLAILYSLIFLFGLAGNLLALWVFIFVHPRRNSVRIFLINVALADLVLVACLPFRILYHMLGNYWPLGSTMCKTVGNLFYMNMYVSITLLGLISLDRYVKIQGWPGTQASCCHRWLKGNSWSLVACSVLWISSMLAVVPMIALAEGNEVQGKCFQYKPRTKARSKAYFNLLMVAIFWLVFLLMVLSYGRIALHLLQASRNKPDLPNAGHYSRAAKKSFVVLFLFTICFVPYHAFRGVYVRSQLTDTPCETRRHIDHANEVMLLFSALNTCLDPLMYFVLSASVRKATKNAISRVLCVRSHSSINSSSMEFHRTSVSQASTGALAKPRGSVGLINIITTTQPKEHP
ncbi:putative G-protein coupled receptor 34a isoform 2-T2 [Clarias gariepinus]|uniref:probable G-protein coupled receptor 34 n=1 Tax=Clarias gariepinus TaxID=13013 RepID=UPI00234D4E99|nr:probable G-protein coupled receptor 34 [Clarias gariepinus]